MFFQACQDAPTEQNNYNKNTNKELNQENNNQSNITAELSAIVQEDYRNKKSASRHLDNKLQTSHDLEEMFKRLRNTLKYAKTSMEEQGINTLYLALGNLLWYETESKYKDKDKQRCAPLVLIPVELSRAKSSRFKLHWTEDDISLNLSLQKKLKDDFNLDLPDLNDFEALDINNYFEKIRKEISSKKEWKIDNNAIYLSDFSFHKLLMYRDLDPKSWPSNDKPSSHPVIQGLYTDNGLAIDKSSSEHYENGNDGPYLDRQISPKDTNQILEADSSQIQAIMHVVKGDHLVIQGPPGTGKSQTVANLLAECVARNKTVLFVAEKLAALKVVKKRLDSIGLGNACLELHSRSANKKNVLEELKRTSELEQPDDSHKSVCDKLKQHQDKLNRYTNVLNRKLPNVDLTLQQLIGEFEKAGGSRYEHLNKLTLPNTAMQWSKEEFDNVLEKCETLERVIKNDDFNTLNDTPFYGSNLTKFNPSAKHSISEKLKKVLNALEQHIERSQYLLETMELNENCDYSTDVKKIIATANLLRSYPDLSEVKLNATEWSTQKDKIEDVIRLTKRISDLINKHKTQLVPKAWEMSTDELNEIRKNIFMYSGRWDSFILFIFIKSYREAKRRLDDLCQEQIPKKYKQQLALLDDIMIAQEQRSKILQSDKLLEILFKGIKLNWDTQMYDKITEVSNYLIEVHESMAKNDCYKSIISVLERKKSFSDIGNIVSDVVKSKEALDDAKKELSDCLQLDSKLLPWVDPKYKIQFKKLKEWLIKASNNLEWVHDVVKRNNIINDLNKEKLENLVDLATNWDQARNELVLLLKNRYYNTWIEHIYNKDEYNWLNSFDGNNHKKEIAEFSKLCESQLKHNQNQIVLDHWTRIQEAPSDPTLSHEFNKKRKIKPVRRLISEATDSIQIMKPIFMMSPLSVAKFLHPGSIKFDLVVFDEASQVRPIDAIGAINRAKQAVVIGDQEQLPPTSFFEPDSNDEQESEDSISTTNIGSILGMFCAANAPDKMLRWHYRSRHDSLIKVSNNLFYNNRLIILPGPDTNCNNKGLSMVLDPDCHYEGGGQNTLEAKKVAQAIMKHAENSLDLTLGVATLGTKQAQRIEDELEVLLRNNSSTHIKNFFEKPKNPEEPFFVKNLENVQGDERDVMLISVCYGKDSNGKISMNFGPINKDGGYRRLNVLFTRAKHSCVVYANFNHTSLSSTNKGIKTLKTFLKYAETGSMDMPSTTGREPDSPFEEAVRDALCDKGYKVECQIGQAGYCIDLAIVDPQKPGCYLLGIECDGATYHSSSSARDRDRGRQQVLESLGWKIYRIWSTDWYANPKRELERAEDAIRQISKKPK